MAIVTLKITVLDEFTGAIAAGDWMFIHDADDPNPKNRSKRIDATRLVVRSDADRHVELYPSGSGLDTTDRMSAFLVYGNEASPGGNYGLDQGYANSRQRTRLFAPSAGDVVLATLTGTTLQSGFAERIVVRGDSGKVGIGTHSPPELLSLNDTTHPTIIIQASGSERIMLGAATAANRLFTGTASGDSVLRATGGALWLGSYSTDELALLTNSIRRIRIDGSTGYVGIGNAPIANRQLAVLFPGASILTVRPTDDTTSSVAIFEATTNGSDVIVQLSAHDTTRTTTVFGLTLGGWATLNAGGTGLLGLALGTSTADPVVIATNNLERIRVLSTGEVGIGITNPARLLVVNGAANPAISVATGGAEVVSLSVATAATSWFPGTVIGDGVVRAITGNLWVGSYAASTKLHLAAAASPGITLDGATGNVGIGTTTPANQMQVRRATGNVSLAIDADEAASFAQLLVRNDLGDYFQFISFGSTDAGATRFGLARPALGELSGNGFHTMVVGTLDASPLVLGTNNAERVRITSDGDVGIGVVAPSAKLHVSDVGGATIRVEPSDNTSASTGQFLAAANGGDNNVYMIAHDTTRTLARSGVTLGGWTEILANGANNAGLLINTAGNDPIVFGTNNAEEMRIAGDGKVGIGTSAPKTILHVYDGIGGKIFGTLTALAGTAATILPNGAGDVTSHVIVIALVKDSSGNTAWSNQSLIAVNANTTIHTVYSSHGITFTVGSDGAFSISRVAGSTRTYNVVFELLWL
jgi:hypothetical protein